MPVRPPAVAGTFYEGSAERLREQVTACVAANPAPAARERFIILCPNHTGFGHFAAINSDGAWRTPLGDVGIDAPLARALMQRTKLLAEDSRAHAREHSLEVQLPFLQHLVGDI